MDEITVTAESTAPLTCADEADELVCADGKCTCPCGIPCTCGGCCGCCEAGCGHDFYCESVRPTPTQAEMFAYFDDMLSAPYRFPVSAR